MSSERKRSVLFVPNFPFRVSGQRHYIPRPDFEFLSELTAKDIAIKTFSFCAPKDDPFSDFCIEDISTAKIADVDVYRGAGSKAKKFLAYLKAIFVGFRVVGRHEGLVYIYFPGPLPTIMALLCILRGKEFALYVRGQWVEQGIAGWIASKVFSKASFIFTTGKTFTDLVLPFNSNASPVYPMISFPEEDIHADEKRDYTGFFKGIYVGHLRASKGVLDILTGIAIAASNGIDLKMDFVGGGNEADLRLFNELIAEKGLANNINYLGHVSDIDELKSHFSAADFFIYPSYYPEGFPRVVYEAMTIGIPIICSILRGMKGFMRDSVNCLEVPVRSPEHIAEKLILLNADVMLRERLGIQAKRDIEQYLQSIEHKCHSVQFAHAYEGVNR